MSKAEDNARLVAEYHGAVREERGADAKKLATQILEINEGLVIQQARRWGRGRSESDMGDLLQAGRMGILRAIEPGDNAFDPSKGSFSTYAGHWIRDHIQRWSGKASAVSRPRSASMPASVARAAAKFRNQNGREPTATDLGVTEEQLQEWSEATHFVELDNGDEEGRTRLELTADPSEAEHVVDRMALELAWNDAVASLSDRNQEIAEAVFWNGEDSITVGERFGLDSSRVRQICARVEERLRRAVKRQGPPSSAPTPKAA